MTLIKPKVSLCCIAKDEDLYLKEWVYFHLQLGFDKIFIYDNDSKNPIQRLIASWPASDKVVVTHWPKKGNENSQDTAYADFLKRNKDSFDWAAILDIDEFINLKLHSDIKNFISTFDTATSIAINWRIFGSAGETRYRPEPVVERFQRASETSFHPNGIIKSIYRLSKTKAIFQHHGECDESYDVRTASNRRIDNHHFIYSDPADFSVAQINHYFVRSREEWVWKNKRGYTDQTVRSAEMFDEYDRNEVEDRSILKNAKGDIL